MEGSASLAERQALVVRGLHRRIAGLEIDPERLADQLGARAGLQFTHFLELAHERRRKGYRHGFGGSHGVLRVLLSNTYS